MAYATLAAAGGAALDVISAVLTVPRFGAWRADLVVDVPAAGTTTNGPVTLTLGSSVWQGFVFRGAEVFGRLPLRLVGGAGGLARPLPGQSYRAVTVGVVIKDILSSVGESLDPTADATTLALPLAAWSRMAGPAASQLEALRAPLGVPWRMLQNGKVWLGPETWPLAPSFDYDLLDIEAHEGRWLLSSSASAVLLPGVTLGGQHVDVVEHSVSVDALRTNVWFS